ncbi:MAG TPA: hypothetical protein VIX73_28920, partial [Kofleriaceae bacterium]
MDDRANGPAFDLAGCTTARGGGWTNLAFVAQPTKFLADFTATPNASPLDATIGFSDGAVRGAAQLAASVRFNPSGTIDVRAGTGYQADARVAYAAGVAYRFHVELDVAAHSYAVSVAGAAGEPVWLARGIGLGSAQAQVAQLDHLAASVDGAGAIEVCGLRITPIDASGCPMAEAGLGMFDRSIGQPGEVVVASEFVVEPDALVEGVIGLSQSGAARDDDLAAAVRLTPGGAIEARDGDSYRADTTVVYAAGQPQRIRIVASVPTHTYSVYVATGTGDAVQLARRYAFAPAQATTGWLGNLDAIVDSRRGAMSICSASTAISIGVRMAREGNYAVAPLPGDEAIVADETTTLHLGASGDTQARLAAGGLVAVDPVGNVYLARVTGDDLVVEAYTAGLA